MKPLIVSLILIAGAIASAPSAANLMGPSVQDPGLAQRADASAAGIEDVGFFIEEREEIMRLVNAGEYGRIPRRDMVTLRDSMARMRELLRGRESAMELAPSQRVELFNAQEAFTAIIQHQRENALVCRRVQPTGSRIEVNQCMTVAEREERRRNDREVMRRMPRPSCVPGRGSDAGSC